MYKRFGLHPDDITSRSMGCNGVDCILTPSARNILDLSIECKNVEALNVPSTFTNHYLKYKNNDALKLLVHKKNRSESLVTLRWEDFLEFLTEEVIAAASHSLIHGKQQ